MSEQPVTRTEFNALVARVDKLDGGTPPPDPTPTRGLELTAVSGPAHGEATATWTTYKPINYVTTGRNGTDTTGAGPWETLETPGTTTRTFTKLTPGAQYTFSATANYTDGTTERVTAVATALNNPTPNPDPTPTPPGNITWSTGAFAMHSTSMEKQFATMRNRPLGNASVFVTHDTSSTTALEATWPLTATTAPAVSIGIPMVLNGGNVISQDLSSSMERWANAMKADGRIFFVRLGWEMNLKNNSRVTDTNLTAWREKWTRYYKIFKTIGGNRQLVGFNPNIGTNQSGLTGSILRAWVDGCVDWCGPDAYDCWPPFNTEANIRTQFTRDQGLNWWATTARKAGVKLAIPEWGVAQGTQWAGNQGGDNPRYITEMHRWMTTNADIMLFDSYFNDTAAYLKSDLINQNPRAANEYRRLWSI